MELIDGLRQDVRHALRQILRAPGFAFAVIATLALAIGANTALFSIVNALILRTLPVVRPHELVLLQARDARDAADRPIYHSVYSGLAGLAAFESLHLYSGGGGFFIEARGARVQAVVEASTPGLFEMLGVQPHAGRFFTTSDSPGNAPSAMVAVLSYNVWMALFNGDRASIGETIRIDGQPMTLIGVTPPGYNGFYADGGMGFSIPLAVLNGPLSSRGPNAPMRGLQAVARMKPGVSLEQAEAVVKAAWSSARTQVPPGLSAIETQEVPGYQIRVRSFAGGFSGLRDRFAQPLLVLIGITAVLLAIGCVNLSGLLLARTVERDRDIAVRMALGASRWRIIQQLVVESLLLSILGAAVALPLAWWTTEAAAPLLWQSRFPMARTLTPDPAVLALAAAVTVITGLALSVLPAFSASRSRPQSAFAPSRTVAHAASRWSQALLVAQVALSLVLLVGAGLFVGSLSNLHNLGTGVRHDGLRWARLFGLPNVYRTQDDAAYYPELYRRLSAVPGVQSLSFATIFPTYFAASQFLQTQPVADAGSTDPAESAEGLMESVAPRFFETVGVSLLGGRDFDWRDDATRPAVAIINESLRRKIFPDGDAVGRRIRIGKEARRASVEVVGVVADSVIGGYKDRHQAVVFRPRQQESQRAPVLLFRTTKDPATIDAAIGKVIAELGHEYTNGYYSLDQHVANATLQERLLAGLASFFAVLAVLLAFVGLYGALAYAVNRRIREIGIRMALGASRAGVLGMVLRQGIVLTAAGLAVGIPLALAAGGFVRSLLFGLDSTDPWTFVVASTFFLLVGALAGFIPARRASAVDPALALRAE